jgi:hypothetical protein
LKLIEIPKIGPHRDHQLICKWFQKHSTEFDGCFNNGTYIIHARKYAWICSVLHIKRKKMEKENKADPNPNGFSKRKLYSYKISERKQNGRCFF